MGEVGSARRASGLLELVFSGGLSEKKTTSLFGALGKLGTFSPWPLSLVDRADSLLLNVGE